MWHGMREEVEGEAVRREESKQANKQMRCVDVQRIRIQKNLIMLTITKLTLYLLVKCLLWASNSDLTIADYSVYMYT